MTKRPTAMEMSTKLQTTSSGRWYGKSVVYGKEDDARTPYMTRYWIGRLRLHIFHRGDQDPDCHDHPWDFWTFPLTPYVEEVIIGQGDPVREIGANGYTLLREYPSYRKTRQIVPAWRPTFRPATHTHRVLSRAVLIEKDRSTHEFHRDKGPIQDNSMRVYHYTDGPIITLVWRSPNRRPWGFLKNRDGKWCWIAWREYVFGGGKSAPCEPVRDLQAEIAGFERQAQENYEVSREIQLRDGVDRKGRKVKRK